VAPKLCIKLVVGGIKKCGKIANIIFFSSVITSMPRRTAYQNGKAQGLHPSVHEQNAKYSKPKQKNGWSAGGQAPQGKPSKKLAESVRKYLEAIHKRDFGK
jgi:hypothetical protein